VAKVAGSRQRKAGGRTCSGVKGRKAVAAGSVWWQWCRRGSGRQEEKKYSMVQVRTMWCACKNAGSMQCVRMCRELSRKRVCV